MNNIDKNNIGWRGISCRMYMILCLCAVVMFLTFSCSHSSLQVAGGGSDTEVSGRIVYSGYSVGRSGVSVKLIKSGYDPAFGDALLSIRSDTTDSAGRYDFSGIDPGIYNILAVVNDGSMVFIDSIAADSGRTDVPDEYAGKTVTLKLILPDSLHGVTGYVIVPGTLIYKRYDDRSGVVMFDSVFQGRIAGIVFRKSEADSGIVLFRNFTVSDADTQIISQGSGSWKHSARIVLNTTASGADVTDNVTEFPVLVRLDSSCFDFSQAKGEGEDIRFYKSSYSEVPFEIEDWDSSAKSATIWIKPDTVYGNSNNQYFIMMWGNPYASTRSSSTSAFDTADGFAGVWHLDESGGTTQYDASLGLFSGTPVEMDGSCDVSGIIGRAQAFDGSSQCITVLNARNSILDVQLDSFYTVSVWVYARTINSGLHVILSKGSAQYGFMINKDNKWEFYAGLSGYGVDTTTTADALLEKWTFITGVRNGMKQYLYVNGELADSTNSARGDITTISTHVYDLVIGRQSDDESEWFDGIIDEVRVLNRVQSPDCIKLCYMNQKKDQNLVSIIGKH
jgi:hypothetical protein